MASLINPKPIAVLSGSRGEFESFIDWVNYNDRKMFVCITETDHIYRREFLTSICIGTFHQRPDAGVLLEEVRIRVRV